MWETGSRWQRKSKKRVKTARSGYSQTSEQTHGPALQGVGRRPRGLSRHEMVLHVTTWAGQPGHPAAKSLRSSLRRLYLWSRQLKCSVYKRKQPKSFLKCKFYHRTLHGFSCICLVSILLVSTSWASSDTADVPQGLVSRVDTTCRWM